MTNHPNRKLTPTLMTALRKLADAARGDPIMRYEGGVGSADSFHCGAVRITETMGCNLELAGLITQVRDPNRSMWSREPHLYVITPAGRAALGESA